MARGSAGIERARSRIDRTPIAKHYAQRAKLIALQRIGQHQDAACGTPPRITVRSPDNRCQPLAHIRRIEDRTTALASIDSMDSDTPIDPDEKERRDIASSETSVSRAECHDDRDCAHGDSLDGKWQPRDKHRR